MGRPNIYLRRVRPVKEQLYEAQCNVTYLAARLKKLAPDDSSIRQRFDQVSNLMDAICPLLDYDEAYIKKQRQKIDEARERLGRKESKK